MCLFEELNITIYMYVLSAFVSGNMIQQKMFRGDKITCTTDSNTFPCINLWYHDNKTFGETITTDSLGEYLCRVQCRIRGTDYTFLALKAIVADPATPALGKSKVTLRSPKFNLHVAWKRFLPPLKRLLFWN